MSAEALFDQLDPILTRWTVGGQTGGLVPAAWEAALHASQGEERELQQLALVAHFLDLCVRPTPATDVKALSDLPPLALPLVPEAQRSLVRRCFRSLKEQEVRRHMVIMLAARGYVVHPADWMPSAQDDTIPDVYAPWRDWLHAQSIQGAKSKKAYDDLTAENWDDWWPAARLAALRTLRLRDPDQARALLEAKAAGESADPRLRLIECLTIGLRQSDVPYLESLNGDRAPKIKALAASLLARLGRQSEREEDNIELATYFKIETKGIFQKTRSVVAIPLKTPAQYASREALFLRSDFDGFSKALELAPLELVAMWPLGTNLEVDLSFAALCERTGAEPCFDALYNRLANEANLPLQVVFALQNRLTKAQRQALATRILMINDGSFRAAYQISGPNVDLVSFLHQARGQALLKACISENDHSFDAHGLGLIASQESARIALDYITRFAGSEGNVTLTDPRFDLLRLNAALPETGARP
ncbi:MAG: hypothetical protein RL145_136 [Pseudomonadota bacterium]